MFLVELLMVKLEINTATHISCGDSSFYPAVNTAATQPSVVGLTTAARALSHSVEVSSDQGMFPHHQELVELDSFSWLDTDFRLSDKSIDQTISLAHKLTRHFGVDCSIPSAELYQDIRILLAACVTEFTKGTAVQDALTTFQHTCWSSLMLHRDRDALTQAGSLQQLVEQRQQEAAADRFNTERCLQVFQDDPELDMLLEIAASGVVVDTVEDFVPLTSPPPLRPLHQHLLPVYRYHAMKLWQDNKALLLPPEILQQAGCHFNPAHWTAKPGKAEGRFLGDCSNGDHNRVLNAPVVRDLVAKRFGPLTHPTISDVIEAVFHLAERHGGLSHIRLWKEDIVGAFGQFNYSSASSYNFAFKIDEELALLQYTGMFGWTGSPYAFGVFTRALQRQAQQRIHGRVVAYVDDFIGISSANLAASDQLHVQRLLCETFGSKAINLEKSGLPATSHECLGWLLDLNQQSVRPSDRAIRKLLFCFHSVNTAKGVYVQLVQVQQLASLARRYSQGVKGMKPFVYPLFYASRGPPEVRTRRLGAEARFCVHMWRCASLLLHLYPMEMAVPLRHMTLQRQGWSVCIWSDAGPRKLGVRIDEGKDDYWITFSSYHLPFDAVDPSYQNTREYMGLLLGLLMLAALGYRDTNILWKGDNISALSWVQKRYVSSTQCQLPFLAMTWLTLLTRNEVVDTEHCPGVHMGDIDGLSRGYSTAFDDCHNGLPPSFVSLTDQLFLSCDPTRRSDPPLGSLFDMFLSLLPQLSAITNLRK